MEVLIDKEVLDDMERVINSSEFTQFLLSHATQIGTSVIILQTLLDKFSELKEQFSDDEE
jgi:hypothetical protein